MLGLWLILFVHVFFLFPKFFSIEDVILRLERKVILDASVKKSACNAGDVRDMSYTSSVAELGRSPGERNGNPLHYSCLENPMDRGAWWAVVHGVAKSWTQLNYWATKFKKDFFNN